MREIRLLRRGDHNALRLRMERERWERQQESEDDAQLEAMKAKAKSRNIRLLFSELQQTNYVEVFGGGEHGRRMAEMLKRIEFDLPLDDLLMNCDKKVDANGEMARAPEPGNQTKSN